MNTQISILCVTGSRFATLANAAHSYAVLDRKPEEQRSAFVVIAEDIAIKRMEAASLLRRMSAIESDLIAAR